MRTWMFEALVVAGALLAIAIGTGDHASEWIVALAVFASFLYSQITDRIREGDGGAPNLRWATRYFFAKEVLFCVYFAMQRSWAGCLGVVIFVVYPAWRKVWRALRPLAAPAYERVERRSSYGRRVPLTASEHRAD